jgi:hypothetical protein
MKDRTPCCDTLSGTHPSLRIVMPGGHGMFLP